MYVEARLNEIVGDAPNVRCVTFGIDEQL
jgi:hypothetical protein